jgi:hypothetical protein
LYEQAFKQGACGCSYYHSQEELQEMDQEVRNVLEDTELRTRMNEKIVELYSLSYSINQHRYYTGYTYDITSKTVVKAAFPFFEMNTIFAHPPVQNFAHTTVITPIEAREAIERVRKFGSSGAIWVKNLESTLHEIAASTPVIVQPSPKKDNRPVVPPYFDRNSAKDARVGINDHKVFPPLGSQSTSKSVPAPKRTSTFKNVPAPKSASGPKSKLELELERALSQTADMENELMLLRREAEERVTLEKLREIRSRQDHLRAEIKKYKDATQYL